MGLLCTVLGLLLLEELIVLKIINNLLAIIKIPVMFMIAEKVKKVEQR